MISVQWPLAAAATPLRAVSEGRLVTGCAPRTSVVARSHENSASPLCKRSNSARRLFRRSLISTITAAPARFTPRSRRKRSGAPQAVDCGNREQNRGSATRRRLDYAVFHQLLDKSDVQAGHAGQFLDWQQVLLCSPKDESAGLSGFGIRNDMTDFRQLHAAPRSKRAIFTEGPIFLLAYLAGNNSRASKCDAAASFP